jgi:hypothetical protein
MIGNYSARLTGSQRNLLALLASSVIFSAGCANMSTTASSGANPFSVPATIGGRVHGGNQQVSGATVSLFYAGQSSPATLAATTTTDSSGSFSFIKDPTNGDTDTGNTYSCPSNTDPLVYVLSQGGNTQNNGVVGQTNTAAAFIAIYGTCKELTASNFVYMSEVTSVATMAAVQQFFNPAPDANNNIDTIVADGTGQEKIIIDNVSNTAALLAYTTTTGLYVPSTLLSAASGGNINPAVTVTATPEPGKVNLLANIISACINGATSAAPACTSLFAAAVPPIPNTTNLNPPGFAAATDTLQALFYMLTNPTSGGTANIATLFALPGGFLPYQPSAAQPTDWTIGINYASTNPSTTCGTPTGGTGGFISAPYDINIDNLDNVWIANSQTGGNLSAITAGGAPLTCVNLDAGSSKGGGNMDSAGNVWFGAGTSMYRYTPSTNTSVAYPVTVSPLGVTADGIGNVYFTAVAGSVGSLYELPAAATNTGVAPVQISNTVGPNPIRLMPDFQGVATQGNLWVSSGSTFVSQVTPGTGPGSLNGFITNPFTTSGNSYGLSVSHANSIFTSAIDTGAITRLDFNGTTWATASGWPYTGSAAGISSPTSISIDGRINTWIPNNGNGASTGSVSEISYFGPNALSPSTGFQKAQTYLNSGRALVVDQAGNVWIAGDGNNFITEIVGSGVPIFQPYAIGLKNGRFQTIP